MIREYLTLFGIRCDDVNILTINDISFDVQKDTQMIETITANIIVDFSRDPHERRVYEYICQITEFCSKKVVILSGNYDDFNNDNEYVYFPFWLMQQRFMPKYIPPKYYRIGLLSNAARFHRIYLLNKIKNNIDIDNDIITVHSSQITSNHIKHDLRGLDLSELPYSTNYEYDDETKRIMEYNKSFKYGDEDISCSLSDFTVNHKAYQCYFNITAETAVADDNGVFFSEKPWKSCRAKCMVINFANMYVPYAFVDMGFVVNEKLDPVMNYIDKSEWISEFMTNDIEYIKEIYDENIDIVNYNQEYFYSDALINKFADYLQNNIIF